MQGIHDRSVLLLGSDNMAVLSKLKVILFGVGGVGSWCAESLVRTGIVHLTLVDSDCVSVSNVNLRNWNLFMPKTLLESRDVTFMNLDVIEALHLLFERPQLQSLKPEEDVNLVTNFHASKLTKQASWNSLMDCNEDTFASIELSN